RTVVRTSDTPRRSHSRELFSSSLPIPLPFLSLDWKSALSTHLDPQPAPSPAAGNGNPAILFEDVEKRFGDHVVLNDLNFSVNIGDRVALIGPSGSGKTTILRLVMTLEEANAGYIYINGQPLTHENRNGRRVELKEKHKN